MRSVLLLICLCILFISPPQQIDADQHVGNTIWSIIRSAESQGIPPESLVPRSRVKRVKRDAFDRAPDQRHEFQNASERVKEHFTLWNDAQGEPLLN